MDKDIAPEYLPRLASDMASRMRLGVLIYIFLWLIVGFGSNLYQEEATLFWGALALFSFFSAARFIHLSSLKRRRQDQLHTWFKQMFCLTIPNAALWGGLQAYAFASQNTELTLLMTFSAAGVILGGVHNLAPRPLFAHIFILVIATPSIIVLLIYVQQWPKLCLYIVYTAYSFNMVRSIHREYWHSIESEFKLKTLSQTDELTQLHNRRFFDEKLEEYCRLSSRESTSLTLMLLDCDHFKRVNDDYGHDIGDRCLQHIATILNTELPRQTDIKARYGGEEFSVILPDTTAENAQKVAENLRERIAATPLKYDSTSLNLSISIGVACRRLNRFEPQIPSELFKEADKALYQAKAEGRNRCVYCIYDDNSGTYGPV